MIVDFSIHHDSLYQAPRTCVGNVALGPLGLLAVLEMQLGLPSENPGYTQSLVAYRRCLEDAKRKNSFYAESLEVDPVGVARTLLTWRNTWYLHGWDGRFTEEGPARLADLAAVERLAGAQLLCEGERLQRVLRALDVRQTQVQKILLLHDQDELPSMWRRVLARFEVEVHPGVALVAHGSGGSDLHSVQSVLLGLLDSSQDSARPKTTLSGDGSLVLVRGVSRDISAQAVAEYVRGLGDGADTLVIAEKDGIVLDNALTRTGAPRCGFSHYSRFRAVTQVLKLSLGLMWIPVNPRLLLQFLLHPVGPLNRFVRARLAEAVANEPGIGGRAWRKAIDRIERSVLDTGAKDKVAKIRESIVFWLEGPKFSVHSGASIEEMIERTQVCANWLSGCQSTAEDAGERESYAIAYRQARDLIDALRALLGQGRLLVPKVELDRLLDEITRPLANPEVFSQAGHVRAALNPSTIVDPVDHIVWWDMSPLRVVPGYPWSRVELDALRAHGVVLPELEELHRRRARDWLRPVMNACKQLVLVFHEREKGDHPLLNQIWSLFEGYSQVRLDSGLISGVARPVVPGLSVPTVDLDVSPLPRCKRWWRFGKSLQLTPRKVESYSSLEKLLSHPHIWFLRYVARLRPGSAEDLPGPSLLHGRLAHRVFEAFFNAHPNWREVQNGQVRTWLQRELAGLIETEAAVLLAPGQGVRRQRVVIIIERALLSLLAHLRAARVVTVQPEHDAHAPFRGNAIAGAIDLLLADASGNESVVDVKWGGEKYRRELLEANRHLQLTVYAYMRKLGKSEPELFWPDTGFFIAETGNVLAQENTVFPDAEVFKSADGEGVADLWGRVLNSYDWRWQQFDDGLIEVVAAGTEADPATTAPSEGFALDGEPDRFDPFTALTGWVVDQ